MERKRGKLRNHSNTMGSEGKQMVELTRIELATS